jgi:hypothetical protein
MSHIYGHGYGLWNVQEDRDLTRAAAERYFQLQALPTRPGLGGRVRRGRAGLRRLMRTLTPHVGRQRGAAA